MSFRGSTTRIWDGKGATVAEHQFHGDRIARHGRQPCGNIHLDAAACLLDFVCHRRDSMFENVGNRDDFQLTLLVRVLR